VAEAPSSADAAGHRPDPTAHPATPHWAKTLTIAAGATLLVEFVLMHALGGGMGNH
jgi:hypothetical protein